MRCVIVLQVTAHQRPTQLHKRWVCCSVLRAASGEVITRLAEVESGVTGGLLAHTGTGTLGHVAGCTAPQTPDTISSEDNDRDELQRRPA